MYIIPYFAQISINIYVIYIDTFKISDKLKLGVNDMSKIIQFPEKENLIADDKRDIEKENRMISDFFDGNSSNGFEKKYAENTIHELLNWLQS